MDRGVAGDSLTKNACLLKKLWLFVKKCLILQKNIKQYNDMKKTFLLLSSVVLGSLAAQADDFPYLTFETADGTKTSVSAASLTITIADGTLTADGKTFALADLSKMYFSASDVTAIDNVKNTVTGEVEVFTLDGIAMGKFDSLTEASSALKSGVYVVKSKSGTLKVKVKN